MTLEIAREHLGALLDGDYLYENTPAMQRLSLALYRRLAEGVAVSPEALASALAVSAGEVAALLSAFPATAIEFDKAGAVVAFLGLGLEPTRHELHVAGRELHTWCAFDALFLPEILGREALVRSPCPASGLTVTVRLGPGAAISVTPVAAVMSIVAPDLDLCRENLKASFCRHVNFFADVASFKSWRGWASNLDCLPIAEAGALAAERNRARFPDITL